MQIATVIGWERLRFHRLVDRGTIGRLYKVTLDGNRTAPLALRCYTSKHVASRSHAQLVLLPKAYGASFW